MGKPGELLKQPKVLISDEATSSLDQNTAEHLALPINQFRGGMTAQDIAFEHTLLWNGAAI